MNDCIQLVVDEPKSFSEALFTVAINNRMPSIVDVSRQRQEYVFTVCDDPSDGEMTRAAGMLFGMLDDEEDAGTR